MTTATEHAGDFFMRLCLSEDGLGYPDRVSVIAADLANAASIVWRTLHDERVPTVVIDASGGETLVSLPTRFERLVDRLRGRSRVWVEARGNGAGRRRVRSDRAELEWRLRDLAQA
jgi:hypothetical protein